MITFLYLGFAGLFYVFLSFCVIKERRKRKIPYGHGLNNEIAGIVSAHSNFASYIPLIFIMLYFLEKSGGTSFLIHFYGSILLCGRLIHFLSLNYFEKKNNFKLRPLGMFMTFFVLITLSFRLIYIGISSL